jgi:3alpha(or 20beta)-hydroxysteroid dehydrogenase
MKAIDLAGKVALVTGAAGGIGAGTAQLLAEAGASVLLTDLQDEKGEAMAASIRAAGGKASYLRQDVVDEAGWEAAVAAAVSSLGGLDILVNNAGVEETVFLPDITLDNIHRILGVNLIGVLLGLKHSIRAMRPGGASGRGGSIVNISSVAGLVGTPGLGTYSASKGGVRLVTKVAALECGMFGWGVRCNSVHPGLVQTDMGKKLPADFVRLGLFPDDAAVQKKFLEMHPIGRIGKPIDIAGAILFLASDLSSWMTGAEIDVDGGLTVS